MAPNKLRDFGGNAYWAAFGGPNRFCDEKVGPQRSQSAPKNETWANMFENEPTMSQTCFQKEPRDWKRLLKVDSFRNQTRCLKTKLKQTEQITKTDSKMAPKKWLYFGGQSHRGAFGGPNRFCDEKLAPNAMTEKYTKYKPKVVPKRAPRMKKNSKILFATKNDAWKQSSNHWKNTKNEFG